MSKRILNKAGLAAILAVCAVFSAFGQATGTYTPYSIFGVGDLSQPGSAYNKTMGGVGIASRNNNYINILNPAAVSARDSLAFMTDFSLYSDNKIFKQGDIISASNTFNINDLVMSFPIWRSSAMMVGIRPYSDTGFGYSFDYTDSELIGRTGSISYSATGRGSVYNVFAAAGVTFFRRLSLGVQWNYYFGDIEKNYYTVFNDASYNSIKNGTSAKISGHGAKFGIQYEQPLGANLTLGVGATYATSASLRGTVEVSRTLAASTSASDTLFYKRDDLGKNSVAKLAGEIGVGISLRDAGRWRAEFDYTRSDWTTCGLDGIRGFSASTLFSTSVTEAYRVGFEIVPNRNDIRYYFNHVAYRVGAYHKKDYFLLNGNEIASTGITLGVTLPVVNGYNGLTLGMEFGQRGSVENALIRERYINFSIGFNLYDIWFRKYQYE